MPAHSSPLTSLSKRSRGNGVIKKMWLTKNSTQHNCQLSECHMAHWEMWQRLFLSCLLLPHPCCYFLSGSSILSWDLGPNWFPHFFSVDQAFSTKISGLNVLLQERSHLLQSLAGTVPVLSRAAPVSSYCDLSIVWQPPPDQVFFETHASMGQGGLEGVQDMSHAVG